MTLFLRMSLESHHNDDVPPYDNRVEYETGDVEYESTNLFYKDDAELPEVETLYEPGDSRQEKTDKVVAAVQYYLDCKRLIMENQFRMVEDYRRAIVEARHHDWERLRDMATRNQGGSLYCSTCSEARTTQIGFTRKTTDQARVEGTDMTRVKHCHYSTLFLNRMKEMDDEGQIYCSFCKISRHYPFPKRRLPLLITASALHGWRSNYVLRGEYEGDEMHVDSIAIPGAELTSLMRAFIAELNPWEGPVDVLVVAGLNDVMKGANSYAMRDSILTFKRTVLNRDDTSTFAMSTLYLAPKLVRLASEPEDVISGPNKYDLICSVNEYIKEQNHQPGQHLDVSKAPLFHTWGIRSRAPTSEEKRQGNKRLLQRCQSFRMDQWREGKRDAMLHLNDHMRYKAGKTVMRYFRVLYGLADPEWDIDE